MTNSIVSSNGISLIHLPTEEISIYSWDLLVPSKTKLVEGFHQPRAPLQISQKICFDTGVLAKARHYWIMTVDIAKIGLTFVLPSENGESKYSVQKLTIELIKDGQTQVTLCPRVTCDHNILNQNEDLIESELSLTDAIWAEDIEVIRFNWKVKTRIGRISLRQIQNDEESISIVEKFETTNVEKYKGFDFSQLLFSDHLSDIVIHSQGQPFPAHRAILSGRSQVFAAMFQHQMRENIDKVLEIEDIHPDVMKETLRYIYTENVEKLEEQCLDILPVAEKYEISGLKTLCENYIADRVTVDDAVETYGYADIYGATILKEKCIAILKESKADLLHDREKLREMNQQQPNLVFDLLM